MTATDSGTIFVSYSHVDRPWVAELVRDLQASGLNIWLDAQKLRPGEQWDTEIEHALQHTGVLMVVLSPDSVRSRNVLDEINYALSKDRLVVPVLYRPCEVPYRIARLQHIDFTGHDGMALVKLVDYLKGAVDQHRTASAAAAPGGPAVPFERRRTPGPVRPGTRAPARFTPRSLALLALPTIILGALALGAGLRRVATPVTIDLVANRVVFVMRGDKAQSLVGRSAEFSELRVEECRSMSLSAAEIRAVPSIPALERRPTTAGHPSTRFAFTCREDGTSRITLRDAMEKPIRVGALDSVLVTRGATVVLDVPKGPDLTLTMDISRDTTSNTAAGQTLNIPIPGTFQILTDQIDIAEPALAEGTRRMLRTNLVTYEARLPESNRFVEIATGRRTVLIVTPPPGGAGDLIRSDAPLEVESIQFVEEPSGRDELRSSLQTGTVAYPGSRRVHKLDRGDFLVLDTNALFIRRLSLEGNSLVLTLDGSIATKAAVQWAATRPGRPPSFDPRQTALQAVWYGPAWRKAAVLAVWLIATLLMRSLAGRPARATAAQAAV